MSLSQKTMEVQIKGDQWKKRFRTVQVYCQLPLEKVDDWAVGKTVSNITKNTGRYAMIHTAQFIFL